MVARPLTKSILPETVPSCGCGRSSQEIKRAGDCLLKVLLATVMLVLHWEFQKRADPQMGPRIHQYQGGARIKHAHEVLSLVLQVEGAQAEAFRLDSFRVGPISVTGWVSISLPRLVAQWPEETDSPLAEMLRALIVGKLETDYLRRLLARLEGLGLSQTDCRNMMLSFLLEIRRGGDGSRYKDIVDEVLTMLQLEDSWIYQAGVERTAEKTLRATLLTIYKKRLGEVPAAVQEALGKIKDFSRLQALIPVFLRQEPDAIAQALTAA